MNLTDLVPSLEVCRQLKEAGFPQDTAMVWVGLWGINAHWHVEVRENIEMLRAQPELDRIEKGATVEARGLVTLSAPTAAEILRELPPHLENRYALLVQDNGLSTTGYDAQWYVGWYRIVDKGFNHCNEVRAPDNPVDSLVLAAANAYLWWKQEGK